VGALLCCTGVDGAATLSQVSTVAGGGQGKQDGIGTSATFNQPRRLAVTHDGNSIIVLDVGNFWIRKIDVATSGVTVLAGTGQESFQDGAGTEAMFYRMTGLARAPSPSNKFYITEVGANRVRAVDAVTRRVELIWDETNVGSLTGATGLTAYPDEADGRVFIAASVRIEELKTRTQVVAELTHSGEILQPPSDIAVDPVGRYAYVISREKNVLQRIDLVTDPKVVTTLAGNADAEAGCVDGAGAAVRFNNPVALAVSPDGKRIVIADNLNHVIREYSIALDKVSTIAGSCADPTPGYVDGAPMDARFNKPAGVAFTPDSLVVLVSDSEALSSRIRSFAVCDTALCPVGEYRSACSVAMKGFCVPCTKAVDAGTSTYTSTAEPFNTDSCGWECSVGYWLSGALKCSLCTNYLPVNASYSSNGVPANVNNCSFECIEGFMPNATGTGCIPLIESYCFRSVYTSPDGLCEGQSFAARGCAANEADHQMQLDEIGKAIDEYMTEDTCDHMLWNGTEEIYANVFSRNGYVGNDIVAESANATGLCSIIEGEPKGTGKLDSLTSSPDCEKLCRYRSLWVHQMMGTCTETPDCPVGYNSSQLLCCYLLSSTVSELCEDYKVNKVIALEKKAPIAGICNNNPDCFSLSGVPAPARPQPLLLSLLLALSIPLLSASIRGAIS